MVRGVGLHSKTYFPILKSPYHVFLHSISHFQDRIPLYNMHKKFSHRFGDHFGKTHLSFKISNRINYFSSYTICTMNFISSNYWPKILEKPCYIRVKPNSSENQLDPVHYDQTITNINRK